MPAFLIRSFLALAALTAWVGSAQTQRWQMKYFYDEDKSSLTLSDLQFPSAQRGIAAGFITKGRTTEGVAVVTADGGEHWQLVPVKEIPVSLFFLNENLGWMVTEKGLWRTEEAGKSWIRVGKLPEGIARVAFTTEKNGWACGLKKTVFQTADGGEHWEPVEAAAEPPGDPKYSAYTWIAFATPQFGLITGWNLPPQRFGPEKPGWLDPESTLRQRVLPHLNYTMVTRDGGKTWRSTSASLFGDTTRVRFLPDGRGLGLVEYPPNFRFTCELYKIDWHTGKSTTVYKDTKFSASDLWLDPDGTAYLSGITEQGKLRGVIPGKTLVLSSKDYSSWTEMPVDYRAVANRTMLAGSGGVKWMATDGGMILKLASPK